MKPPVGKRRTREHVIADLSVNHVERHILKCGFVVERPIHDYGIDLEINFFNKQGEIQEGHVLVQLKASDRLRLRPGQTTFAFSIERSNLVSWLRQLMPVILIVYDARKEVAYWLYFQSYFKNHPTFQLFAAGQTITVHIPTDQVVNSVSVKKFTRFRERVLKQVRNVVHNE